MAGSWDGKRYCLREFPVSPESGSVNGVDWRQTVGKITLRYELPRDLAQLAQEDFAVELSAWELKVRCRGKDSVSPLCGDLVQDVQREKCWWALQDGNGRPTLVIDLAKKELKPWTELWKSGMNPRRKMHFGWGPNAPSAPPKKEEDTLAPLTGGRPPRGVTDPYVTSREALCTEIEEGQDTQQAVIRVRFRPEVMEKAVQQVSMAELFGVDIMSRTLKVFIRGAETDPIMLGELGGQVIPEETTWELQQVPDDEKPGVNIPALQVLLRKHVSSQTTWETIFEDTQASRLMQRETGDELEDLHRGGREKSPDRSEWGPMDHAYENKLKGDACFKKGDFFDAAVFYSRAIKQVPQDPRLYSNRSAAYNKLKKNDKALEDANQSINIAPEWPKAYFRQGVALRGLLRWDEALAAFNKGQDLEPGNLDWEREIEKTEQLQGRVAQHREEVATTKLQERGRPRGAFSSRAAEVEARAPGGG